MKRIVFQSNQLSVRGTEVALYDYALYNREILGNESIVVYGKGSPSNDSAVIEKFRRQFPVHAYEDFSEVDHLIEREKADIFYAIKAGRKDGVVASGVPTMVHAVFPTFSAGFHGATYAFVSDWLSAVCSNRKAPVVPHIVSLPSIHECMRDELGIPEAAMVFGCHGGADSFDLDFARFCVLKAVEKRSNVYFVFLNIPRFVQHERVFFLPRSADIQYKVRFINTCDAMLHARKRGETFGLACAEFSARNRPVLTYSRSGERNHIDVMADKAFLYDGPRSLLRFLLELRPEDVRSGEWDCYSKVFSPERVMRRFQDVFVDGALLRGLKNDGGIALDWVDRLAIAARRVELRRIKLSRLLPG
ncbi:MAG: hypothetical protein Q8J78_05860 [Moraxellaceae bacterium]|nr:hypothetical protein [Moraxellaceae bacterium]